jgi:hypothetical protein
MRDQGTMEDIRVSVGTDKPRYQFGEHIAFTLTISNTGANPVVVGIPTAGLESDIIVRSSTGVRIWTWSSRRLFFPVTRVLTLMPDQVSTYTRTWDQKTDQGEMATPGEYTVTGLFGDPPVESSPVTFIIH